MRREETMHVEHPHPACPDEIGAAVRYAIALVNDLIAVLDEENAILSRGFPASIIGTIERKNALGIAFEAWVANVQRGRTPIGEAAPALRRALAERSHALEVVVDENLQRLHAAALASQRRLEALMRAVREECRQSAPYTASGRVHLPSTLSAGAHPATRV